MKSTVNGKGNKRSRILKLLRLQGGEIMDSKKIAEIVGTSVEYVRNVEYDVRSNGGVVRAQIKYCKENPHIYSRWRKQNPEKYKEIKARLYDKSFAHQHRQQYTDEEKEKILNGSGETDHELAKELGRTVHAIQNRRYYLRKKMSVQS